MATQTIDYNINVNAGSSLRTIQDIENELNELNQEIKEVGVGSAAFDKAAGNIQKLESELRQTQSTVEGFTLDKKLETADGAIKVVAGSVTALTGGLGLLGIENENFEKLTAQATNAIAFGMGIKDLSEGFGKLAKNLNVAGIAQKAYNLVQRAFNAILNANPIGLTILAITTLTGLVIGLKDKFEAVNKVFQFFKGLVTAVGEALGLAATAEEKAAQAAKEASEQRIKDIDNELKIRKAAGEDTVELEREKQQLLTSITEEGSQERKDAMADEEAFEAAQLKKKQDAIDAAADEAKRKRDELKAEADAKAIADKEVADQKAADKKQEDEDKEKARLEGIQAVVDEFEAKQRDLEVESELERLELEQERKLAELGTTVEDLEAKKAIEVFYATLTAEELERIRLQDLADDKAILEAKKIAQMNFVSAVGGVINALGGLAAEGTAAAKTAALADIVINTGLGFAQGLDIAQKGAKATGPAAPFAFPIFYATQIAAVIGAISKAKNILSQVKGGGAGGGAITAPNVAQTPSISSANLDIGVSPETQVAGTAVQAYVVSGDITSSQEAEAKLSTRRAIGG
mgnify:FL=1